MAEVVPKGRAEKLRFFQQRRGAWALHAAELGLPPAAIAEMEATLDAATAAAERQYDALSKARSATLAFNTALDALAGVGSKMLKRIKATAAAEAGGEGGENRVYALAQIGPPADPSPVAPPGIATTFAAQL